jgi:predicted RNA methylase
MKIRKDKTIEDFGEQWSFFTDNTGYYSSIDVLIDILGPDFDIGIIKDATIIDLGAGTGRLSNLFAEYGAKKVYAIEPSKAFNVLKKNTLAYRDKIECIQLNSNEIPDDLIVDIVVSIGVIHHIQNPDAAILKSFKNIKSGGQIVVWLYGYEGNELYIFITKIIRFISKKLPHNMLYALSIILLPFLKIYAQLCKSIDLPMKNYMNNHINKLDYRSLLITIYDQLNPHYAKYYKKKEAIDLLLRNGFTNVKIYHRHNYSWTVVGKKN